MNLTTTEIAIAAIAIPAMGALATLMQKSVSAVFSAIYKTLVTTQNLTDSFSSQAIIGYLMQNAKSFGFNQQAYQAHWRYILSEEKSHIVFQRNAVGSSRVFLYRGAPMVFSPASEKGENKGSQPVNIQYIKGTVDWHDLLIQSATFREEQATGVTGSSFYIYNYLGLPDGKGMQQKLELNISSAPTDQAIADEYIGYRKEDIGLPQPADPLKNLFMSAAAKRVLGYVKFWYRNERWYKDREIPHQLGIGLYGKPGSGKSRLIRTIAQHIGIPIHSFNLASMTTHDFVEAWATATRFGKRLVLFEDFDTVFHGRKNVIPGHNLSFQTILNSISGVEQQDGLLLFLTTNHPELLDHALCKSDADTGMATRPNRIDFLVELPDPDFEARIKIGERIAGAAAAEKLAREAPPNETIAQYQWRCTEHALKNHWSMVELESERAA